MRSTHASRSGQLHHDVRLSFMLMVLSLSCLLLQAQETVTFTFNPPDGLSYTEIIHREDSVEISNPTGQRLQQSVSIEEKTKTDIHKTPEGYTLTKTIFAATRREDGKQKDPVMLDKLLLKVPLTLMLAPDGTLQSVSGSIKRWRTLMRRCQKTTGWPSARSSRKTVCLRASNRVGRTRC